MHYSSARVSKSDPNIDLIAQSYRQLRLTGLQLSPDSFAVKYLDEVYLPLETWIDRLKQPGRETFVSFVTNSGTESNGTIPLDAELVAQTTVLGPLDQKTFALAPEAGEPRMQSDEQEERWHMTALYTLPAHRGKGVAKELCQEVFRYLTVHRPQPPQVRVRIMIGPTNTIVFNLYSRLGFVHGGRTNLAEALRANGDAHSIPQDAGKQSSTRQGYVMFRILDKAT